jgi:hypothetical protein
MATKFHRTPHRRGDITIAEIEALATGTAYLGEAFTLPQWSPDSDVQRPTPEAVQLMAQAWADPSVREKVYQRERERGRHRQPWAALAFGAQADRTPTDLAAVDRQYFKQR